MRMQGIIVSDEVSEQFKNIFHRSMAGNAFSSTVCLAVVLSTLLAHARILGMNCGCERCKKTQAEVWRGGDGTKPPFKKFADIIGYLAGTSPVPRRGLAGVLFRRRFFPFFFFANLNRFVFGKR